MSCLEDFSSIYREGIYFVHSSKISQAPVSQGKGHKSQPLRDYTLLKAYDPGWMESRAWWVGVGCRKDFSLPGMILADTLALAPHFVPHSQPYKQVYY